jgi:hypothetical protein
MNHPWPPKTFEPSILAALVGILAAALLWLPWHLGRFLVGLRRDA